MRRVFEQDAWADRALHGEARRLRLDARDLALATQLSYGTVQRVATLDHVIERLARRPSAKLDPPVLAALRLGVFQLTFLDRVPAHAAVGESVELAKRDAPRGAGLVNAVLRRAAREARRDRRPRCPTPRRAQAALRHSHPEWIAELWFEAFGAETARALMAADNEPAEAVAAGQHAQDRPRRRSPSGSRARRRRRRGADPRRARSTPSSAPEWRDRAC